MAALVPGTVVATRCAKRTVQRAGEAGGKGMPVYHDQATGKWFKALNDTVAHAAARGIATHDFTLDNPITIATGGDFDIGVATVDGETYYVGPGGGEIVPHADLMSGDIVTPIGIGKAGNVLGLMIYRSDTAKP
jgi:hypothetical protein